jgi:hypothetical protein
MSASYDKVFQKCSECGAQCGPTAERCWMCNALLPRATKHANVRQDDASLPAGDRSLVRSTADTGTGGAPKYLLILLLFSLGVIGVGLWSQAQGLALLYLIVVVPAILAMFVSLDRQRQSGEASTVADYVVGALSALLKTVAVFILILIAIIIAGGIFCFVMISSGAFR